MTKAQSKVEAVIKETSKVHTQYLIKGNRLPSCSGIVGVMNKPALVPWANRMGLEGINTATYVDKLAKAGTLAHTMVENYFKKKKTDFDNYSKNEIEAAKVSYGKFLVWQKENNFIMVESELKLKSKRYMFGGTLDLYGILKGKRTLLDVKTSKAIYKDYFTQVGGGYNLLLEENGREVEDVKILRLGRNEEEGWECRGITGAELELHKARFLICRELYDLNKRIGF
jgi:hypothetical protein